MKHIIPAMIAASHIPLTRIGLSWYVGREAKLSENVYTLQGMTCEHCVDAVISELSSLAAVTHADVDLASGRVRVFSDQPLDDDAVRAGGYEVVS
jgi:copper chaperone CopZ